ncbi:gluconolactonase [Hortaea werneckii]|nr:gluconolactonase [Hortaea werneckii]
MNFFSPPPTITAKVHATLPDSLICREPSEWTGGFAGGYNDVFLEGPTVGTSDSVFVTDIPHGRILEVDEQGKFTECLKYDGEPNGMAVRKDGKFVVADYKQGMLLFDPETRTMSPLVTRWNLERFKGPNDVIVDSKENVYFTDQGQTSMTDQTGRVYRLCPDGRLDTLLTNGISPNGLVLSPDEKYLSITAQSPIDFWGVLSNVKLLDVGMDAREGLHACKRCRARKVKCDKIAPSCSPCAKAGVHCVFIDGNSHVEYSRAEIARLEDEERSLRATFQNSASENVTSPHSAEPSPAFVGESSGISSRLGESRGQVLKQLLKRPQQQAPAIAPANFPCFEAADYLVRTYLGESHLQKPFLLEGEVYELLSRIYPSRGDSLASDEDRFRLLMICAIAAVRLHRRGIVDVHPFAFFQAARKYFAKIPLLAGLASIQNLLLLARFGACQRGKLHAYSLGSVSKKNYT